LKHHTDEPVLADFYSSFRSAFVANVDVV